MANSKRVRAMDALRRDAGPVCGLSSMDDPTEHQKALLEALRRFLEHRVPLDAVGEVGWMIHLAYRIGLDQR